MKFCCLCRQCSKNFENIKELKQHNCTVLTCPQHTESYIKQRTAGKDWEKQECCQKYNKFTQRTLGLMKVRVFRK